MAPLRAIYLVFASLKHRRNLATRSRGSRCQGWITSCQESCKHVQARGGSQPKPRLPITPDFLDILCRQWLCLPHNSDYIMLWTAACMGFFGFLRAGEFTVPTAQSYDPEVHLSLCDMALGSHSAPSLIAFASSKARQTHSGRKWMFFLEEPFPPCVLCRPS